jgi:AhpD family alkylhydroperoxidase
MRLRILDSGHAFGTKLLFAFIRTVSRQPVLDVIKLVKYRADFYGAPMSRVTQEAMRGPSTWSVADRELMAAFVAKTNQCEFCIKAHSAVAQRAYGSEKKVSALLFDPDFGPLEGPLQADARARSGCRGHASSACGRRFAPTDRGCAGDLFLVQCDRSVGRCLRFLRARSRGLRIWREIPPRARLQLRTYSGQLAALCCEVRRGNTRQQLSASARSCVACGARLKCDRIERTTSSAWQAPA